MQVSITYNAIPARSTNTDPTIWELKVEAKGSYAEIKEYAQLISNIGQAGGFKKVEK